MISFTSGVVGLIGLLLTTMPIVLLPTSFSSIPIAMILMTAGLVLYIVYFNWKVANKKEQGVKISTNQNSA